MEVILKQDVDKVGKSGAVVKVKDGFARNFLIPNNLAVPLNPSNLKLLEEEHKRSTQRLAKAKQDAEALKEKLSAISLTVPVETHEEDKMYGSISAQDICGLLKDEGVEIDKGFVELAEPIKALGIYQVPIKLHPEVSAQVKLWVVKK
jgi:large subunit ribosomal protein L9